MWWLMAGFGPLQTLALPIHLAGSGESGTAAFECLMLESRHSISQPWVARVSPVATLAAIRVISAPGSGADVTVPLHGEPLAG